MNDDIEIVNVRLPRDLFDRMKADAAHEDRSQAATIRVALRCYLDAKEVSA